MGMTEKELKKLSRGDLLEMLIDQSAEVQLLREKLERAEAELAKKELTIDTAGSIAEASLQLNGVFEAAQAAGAQYLENIRLLSERQETVCRQMEKESQEKAGQLLLQAEQQCEKMESETRLRCEEMTARARVESQSYWNEVSAKLDEYCAQHAGLRELLSIILPNSDQR